MKLHVYDDHKFVDIGFGFWLIPMIRAKLITNSRRYKLANWDKFLNESESISRLYSRKYTTQEIIIFAANNLTCKGIDGDINILFAEKPVPGFDRLSLNSIIKTINYGTLDVKACPIFTDTLNFFAENINTYLQMYYEV